MRYPGGKGKTYQQIINLLPKHAVYIEPYLGGGAVLLHKKPSLKSIALDRDPLVIRQWRCNFPLLAAYMEGDALQFLASRKFGREEIVYCDPPYLPSTRRRDRVYRYDYAREDHESFLEVVRGLACNVLISGYPSKMYDTRLKHWNTHTFAAKAHDGPRMEKLWFNYDPPDRLHDSRYLGTNYRERQTFRRRIDRFKRRISSLSSQEQHCLSEWLVDNLFGA
jgi:DNA adenine methylase